MKKLVSLLSLFSLFSFPNICFSQENPEKLSYRSTLLGMGRISLYDTYLSPLDYTGNNIGFLQENTKMTSWMEDNVAAQHLFSIQLASARNKAKTAMEYAGNIEYAYGLYYRFSPLPDLKVFAGTQAEGLLGFIYNTRNSNNPVAAKANLNLALSAAASYELQIRSFPFRLRYQFSTPFLGMMFSPEYGQAYYEISLGNNDNLVHFASFHNQLCMKNHFSIEFPVGSVTVRLMYLNAIYETNINEIETRIRSNSLMIGFSREFFSISGKKKVKGNYNRVFE